MADQAHHPVLLEEVVEAMNIREDGYYLDATAGRGGHVAAILEKLGADGRILALDRDPQAVAAVSKRFLDDRRVQVRQRIFSGGVPVSIKRMTRLTSTWVLPEPALADTQAETSGLEARA